MSISTEEVDAVLESIEDTESWTYKIERLTKALEAQYELGVQEGFKRATALFATGSYVGALTPNSFEMSKTSDNPNNSDDLYMNS